MLAVPAGIRTATSALLKAVVRRRWFSGGVIVAVVAISLAHPGNGDRESPHELATTSAGISNEPIQPLEKSEGVDSRKIALGRRLFRDPRLSHDNTVSCASCHGLTTGGSDRRVYSVGINNTVGQLNAPTVFNSALNFSQFWDGRAGTLEAQVDYPIQSGDEMGSNWIEVIGKLRASGDYVSAFQAAYRKEIEPSEVRDAIAAFERSLSTPNSLFDRYLRHDASAINARQEEGYRLFKTLGCASCHQGVNIGGNMYQKVGVMVPYFEDETKIRNVDRGRFNVTHDTRDMFMFKVPGLRNVALTAPYFHDGSARTLDEAVRAMAKYQLSRTLAEGQVQLIVEFLKTLTGELGGVPL